MKRTKNQEHSHLLSRIAELRKEKGTHDAQLNISVNSFVDTLNPAMIVKESIHQLAKDKDVHTDLLKVGISLGTEFIIGRIFNKNASVGNFANVIISEKITDAAIQKNMPAILMGVSNLMYKISEPSHSRNLREQQDDDL